MLFISVIKLNLVNDNLLAADDLRELTKLIKIGQNNSSKLNLVMEYQTRLKAMMNEQKGQIAEMMLRLGRLDALDVVSTKVEMKGNKGKGKNKGRKTEEFYQVNIILYYFFILFLCYNYLYIITYIIGCNQKTCL